MPDNPAQFQFRGAEVVLGRSGALRTSIYIGYPLAFLCGPEQGGAEVVAVCVCSYGAVEVLADKVWVVVSDCHVILVDNEYVPLAIDAFRTVLVFEGGVKCRSSATMSA